MNNAIEWCRPHLKCDAAGCDYFEEVEEISAGLIGKKCPKCGANLLTEEDHKSAMALKGAVDLVNSIVGPVKRAASATPTFMSVNPHEDTITIKLSAHPHQE